MFGANGVIVALSLLLGCIFFFIVTGTGWTSDTGDMFVFVVIGNG